MITNKRQEIFSKKKEKFNEGPLEPNNEIYTVNDIRSICGFYDEKYGITIRVNNPLPDAIYDELRSLKAKYKEEYKEPYSDSKIRELEKEILAGPAEKAATEEMSQIIQTLKHGEMVGYVYTRGIKEGVGHFEVYLLLKDKIVKPIHWEGAYDYKINFDNHIVYEQRGYFDAFTSGNRFSVCPQMDYAVCGVIGISVLKELLKNNGENYNSYALT